MRPRAAGPSRNLPRGHLSIYHSRVYYVTSYGTLYCNVTCYTIVYYLLSYKTPFAGGTRPMLFRLAPAPCSPTYYHYHYHYQCYDYYHDYLFININISLMMMISSSSSCSTPGRAAARGARPPGSKIQGEREGERGRGRESEREGERGRERGRERDWGKRCALALLGRYE